jgi:hypothetical protein
MSDLETITSCTTNEYMQFTDGARRGYLLYRQLHQGKPLSPRELYDFLMNILIDITHPSLWNAGYIAGWFTAFHQDGNTVSLSTLAQQAAALLEQLQVPLSTGLENATMTSKQTPLHDLWGNNLDDDMLLLQRQPTRSTASASSAVTGFSFPGKCLYFGHAWHVIGMLGEKQCTICGQKAYCPLCTATPPQNALLLYCPKHTPPAESQVHA